MALHWGICSFHFQIGTNIFINLHKFIGKLKNFYFHGYLKVFYNRFECVSFLKIEERVVISINNDKATNNFVQTNMV